MLFIVIYFLNANDIIVFSLTQNMVKYMVKDNYEKAIFAGGCFWCTEATFEQIVGVIEAISGYTGGDFINPTYEQVAKKMTDHVEAVEVTYNPEIIGYKQLLDAFWRSIDPFNTKGQFCDIGNQYKTVIFYLNDEQKQLAEESKQKLTEKFGAVIATEIRPAKHFYIAEDEHQGFYKNNKLHYESYSLGSGRKKALQKIWQE